ncbi:MAG: 1-deoxy-D-xylulose-5-phosphate synthase [Nanoarchaeota archaeon]
MSKILDMITNPKDLRFLTKDQLSSLAHELREKIINTVAKNGGHLASSLGVVELTMALHYVFDLPNDQLIWDVGHQSYVHKLLTGRAGRFHTLRQYKGISGFPKREESVYDSFNTGHSSTSISAALGKAKARDIKKENYKVIAVIGDGALTGGMSFEAMNQAGHLKTDLVLILNDNTMSISPNVGALTSYLRRMVTDPKYLERKKTAKGFLERLPMIGSKAPIFADNLEETLRAFTTTPGLLFKELGFSYFGPVDGHDLGKLITGLRNLKQLPGPKILHVITKKGHGYRFAEENKTKFHGISQFDISSGEKLVCDDHITYTEAFSKCLCKLAQENKNIVAITAAMASGTGLDDFSKKFPDRFFDVGIAEQHAVTFAAGLASQGLKPVVTIYSTFLQRAYDQIIHDVALQNLPVIFAIDRAGFVGADGPTHHGNFDLSYLRHIPNMVVCSPKDENELCSMLKTAVDHNGPIAIRYPRGCGLGVTISNPYMSLKIGKSETLLSGPSMAIFAIGNMVNQAYLAAIDLKKKGIKCTVLNSRFVKPLDEKRILQIAKKIKNIITVEENALEGGFGSAILELLEQNNIKVNITRMGIPNKFIEHGKMDILRRKYGLTKEGILRTAFGMIK